MFFFYKIINIIDGILNKIPKDIAVNIKRLSGFIFIVLSFVALYFGYNMGVKNSEIPGAPLVRETNDALRLRLKGDAKKGNMQLVDAPPPIVDTIQNPYQQNESYSLQKEDFARDNTPLGEQNIRDIKTLHLRPMDNASNSYSNDSRIERAKAPKPLSQSLQSSQSLQTMSLDPKKKNTSKKKSNSKPQIKPDEKTKNSALDPAPYKPLDMGQDLLPQTKNPARSIPLGDDTLRQGQE